MMNLDSLFDDVTRLIDSASKEDLLQWHQEAVEHSAESYLWDDPEYEAIDHEQIISSQLFQDPFDMSKKFFMLPVQEMIVTQYECSDDEEMAA